MSEKKILLVDDSQDIHHIFEILFANQTSKSNLDNSKLFGVEKNVEKTAINLISAYQGLDAIELYRKSIEDNDPFDLVVCDMRMPPGIDGLETLRNMASIDEGLKAIICTAFSDFSLDEVKKSIGQVQSISWLNKPFTLEQIREAVYPALGIN